MGTSRTNRPSLRPSERAQVYLHYLDIASRSKEQEESQSEQRVKFFIAIISGTVAILGYFRERLDTHEMFWVSTVALSILFLFGLVTFARVAWRSRAIDQHDELIQKVSTALKQLDSAFHDDLSSRRLEDPSNAFLRTFKGTLAQYLYVTQALITAALAVIISLELSCRPGCTTLIATLSVVIVISLLFLWSNGIRVPKDSNIRN